MTNPTHEIATAMIEGGWRVVPIKPNTKRPIGKDWQNKVYEVEDFPAECGVGIMTGHGVIAIDIDSYDPEISKAVADEAKRRFGDTIERVGQFPKTALFFRAPAGLKKRTVKLASSEHVPAGKEEAVEVLAKGQQCVAYGVHPDTGQPYKWVGLEPWAGFIGGVDFLAEIKEPDLKDFLNWVQTNYGNERPKLSEQAMQHFPTISAGLCEVEEAKELLSYIPADCGYDDWLSVLMACHSRYGGAQEGLTLVDEWSAQGGKYRTGEVAQKWNSFSGQGVNWETVPALARQHGADLSAIARKHKTERSGNGVPDHVMIEEGRKIWNVWNGVESWDQPAPEPIKLTAVNAQLNLQDSAAFCATRKPADYLVEGSLRDGWLYTLTAPTGHGKSAVALTLAYAIAAGGHLGSYEVKQGSVLFLAGENHDDIRERWIAMCEKMGRDPASLPVTFMPGVWNLKQQLAALSEHFAANPLRLVIVDTLAAFFNGDNENDNAQLQAFTTDVLRPLTELPGRPAVVVPAHPTKGAGKDALTPKGGSSLLNAIDGNLSAWNSDGTVRVHWQGKFRGAPWNPIHFQLSEYVSDKLRDRKGNHMPTVTARAMMDSEIGKAIETAQKIENQVLKLLLDGLSVRGIAEDVIADGKRGVSRMRVQRCIETLKQQGWIARNGRKWGVTTQGMEVLKQAGEGTADT